jgi:hypothetical protein
MYSDTREAISENLILLRETGNVMYYGAAKLLAEFCDLKEYFNERIIFFGLESKAVILDNLHIKN